MLRTVKKLLLISVLAAILVPSIPTDAALTIRGIDIMGWTKDYLNDPFSEANINTHVAQIKSDFPTLTHIAIAIPMNTQAEAVAEGTSLAIQPSTYAARFATAIHNQGLGVIWRGTDNYFEHQGGDSSGNVGLYSFPWKSDKASDQGVPQNAAAFRNGNRFTYFGTPITDNFDSDATRDHGYGLTSAAGATSSRYLTAHQSGNSWSIVNDELTGPSANAWKRTILFNPGTAYLRDYTATALVKVVNNQQLVIRASTDENFPGYGLQIRRADGVLRLERPGLANLGEVVKTFNNGEYHWLKLQGIGTAIKAKSWIASSSLQTFAEGQATEPGTWDIEVTNTEYPTDSGGYVGFSGEDATGKFRYLHIDPEVDTSTWTYRAGNFVSASSSLFSTGDIVVPYPEASIHQVLTRQGTYNNFYIDLKYVIERTLAEKNVGVTSGYFSHIFTAVIQGTYNSQYTDAGAATYDHYGSALGLNRKATSFSTSSLAVTNTSTVLTSISETAGNKANFIPEKSALNTEIDVYIVNKGTGDWTMTIHDPSGNPVRLYDQHDLASTTINNTVTIPNASLSNNTTTAFLINWHNPDTDQTYHYHLTSTVGDGTIKTQTAGNLYTAYSIGYKSNASPQAMELDIRNAYQDTGSIPQFLQEWGDFWSTDSSESSPVRNQAETEAYLDSMYATFQRLVDDGILFGFNYWRTLGEHEAIYNDMSTLNYKGQRLQAFFAANADATSSAITTKHNTRYPSVQGWSAGRRFGNR